MMVGGGGGGLQRWRREWGVIGKSGRSKGGRVGGGGGGVGGGRGGEEVGSRTHCRQSATREVRRSIPVTGGGSCPLNPPSPLLPHSPPSSPPSFITLSPVSARPPDVHLAWPSLCWSRAWVHTQRGGHSRPGCRHCVHAEGPSPHQGFDSGTGARDYVVNDCG